MSKFSLGRTIGVGTTVLGTTILGATGILSLGATAASATPSTYLTAVGSNTTQEVMGAITSAFNNANTTVQATNVYAQPADPGTTAPSDVSCNGGTAITYISETDPGTNQRTAPNGSGAGRTALATSVSNGDSCVSVARSSSPPSSTDPAGTQAVAYATDAVSWIAESGGNAPKNLTITKLEGIYDCTYTNWKQVGGKSGTIVRYYPQAGSGTASFFAGVLGFDPRTLGTAPNNCTTEPTEIEENEATAINSTDAPNAIDIYSSGAWIAQANGVDPDERNGFVIKEINGKGSPVTGTAAPYKVNTSLVTEAHVEPANYNPTSNTAVQGVRNLFNFINTSSVDYTAAKSFVGLGSLLCTGKDATAIKTYGFNPLPTKSKDSCLIIPEP